MYEINARFIVKMNIENTFDYNIAQILDLNTWIWFVKMFIEQQPEVDYRSKPEWIVIICLIWTKM